MALALYTFGMFAARAEDPANDGFRDLNDPIFELADRAEGLIARSGYASDPGPLPWGADWGADVDRGIPLMGALVRPAGRAGGAIASLEVGVAVRARSFDWRPLTFA